MSKIIVLYNYNKYYNRIVKKLATFADYQALITPANENTPAVKNGFTRNKVNFDFQDGVHASLVLNIKSNEKILFKVDQPDYCVVETTYKETIGGVTNEVAQLSRWFILESTKLRGGQWEISLRRDLLADYYEEVTNAPVFIERGMPSVYDPAVFNRESFTYNQIKKDELLLNFNKLSGKGAGWIVGYLARNDGNGQVTEIIDAVGHAEIPEGVPDFSTLPAKVQALINGGGGYYSQDNSYMIEMLLRVNNRSSGDANDYRRFQIHNWDNNANNSSNYGPSLYSFPGWNPYVYFKQRGSYPWYVSEVANYLAARDVLANGTLALGAAVQNWYNSLTSTSVRFNDLSIINTYNGMVYQKDGKLYRLTINTPGSTQYTTNVAFTPAQLQQGSGSAPALAVIMNNYLNNYIFYNVLGAAVIIQDPNIDVSKIALTISKPEQLYTFVSELAEYDEVKASITSARNENLDAPYDIFCIPIGEVSVKNNNALVLTNVANVALGMARGIAVKGTTALVYDIQILPYCPFDEILNSDGDIEISGFTSGKDYTYITKISGGVTTNVGIIIFPKSCKGTFNIDIPDTVSCYNECLEDNSSVIDKKVKAETRLVRFVSPNFASTFDINVQKNKGIVNLNVDYFYKPYSPYIHVAPYFNGLYGQDFDDPKGLICSGDFSIASASSQWEAYQIQNKNYELIFNRQIQNLDVNNAIAYEQLKTTGEIGKWTAAIQGVAAGAVTGATAGSAAGPWGAVAGAVVGGAAGGVSSGLASAYGAKMDLEYLSRAQREARSYATDMYTYNLGNIQALPNTLTRVSAFTQNNKIFPFIEFYDCTDEERQALIDKIKYNGMTVMRIGAVKNFIGENDYRYVQAQLIRLTGINEDSHVVAEIANELKGGAYYYGSDSE